MITKQKKKAAVNLGSEASVESYLDEIDRAFEVEKDLLLALAKKYSTQELKEIHESLSSFKRHERLEQEEYENNQKKIKPTHIASKNFRKMEQITAAKWFASLVKLFDMHHTKTIDIHHENGRLKIAIPGVRLGLEVGGLLDFFNFHGVAVDIDAVDLLDAGREEPLYDLERRKALYGSTVKFHPKTDANAFFKDYKADMVILRNPGDIFTLEGCKQWFEILKTMAGTHPEIVVLSTYEYGIDDKEVIKKFVGNKQEEIEESYIFNHYLNRLGFHTVSTLRDEWLRYPISPYMIKPEIQGNELSFIWTSDRFMGLYYKI